MTSVANHPTRVSRLLLIDAATCGTMGVLLLLAARSLDVMLGLPASLLRSVGLVLVPFAVLLVWLAPRAVALRQAVRLVVGGNVLWVIASVLLLVSGEVDPTPLGTLFIAAQAAVVALLAILEHRAVARDGRARALGSTLMER